MVIQSIRITDGKDEGWGTVRYRMQTTEWNVLLELVESDARYGQCYFYTREWEYAADDDSQDPETAENAGGEGTV